MIHYRRTQLPEEELDWLCGATSQQLDALHAQLRNNSLSSYATYVSVRVCYFPTPTDRDSETTGGHHLAVRQRCNGAASAGCERGTLLPRAGSRLLPLPDCVPPEKLHRNSQSLKDLYGLKSAK